jgi:hypothetical protein
MGWNQNEKFTMPMFNTWVPEGLRPWMYLLFAFCFQLSGGVYFGNLQHMAGEMSLLREDVQMVAMMGVVGVNMPFPFLFRYKLRFTNRQLLIHAAIVIAVCNVLSLYVHSLPVLCAISYVAGFLKLCGTFECFSNIRLWISPKQDFGVFLPTIYIFILAAQPVSNWMTLQLTMTFDSWQTMHWLIAAVMLMVALLVYVCTHPWRMTPRPLPLVSLDWLGCLLWSAVMLEVIWLFTYGEHFNWWQSSLWRGVLYSLPVTLLTAIGRMTHIRHPYIAPEVWMHWRLLPILGMFFMAEVMNATPHVLQGALTGNVLHWGYTTTRQFCLFEMLGYVGGCVFTILWGKETARWGIIPRWGFAYTRLLSVGFLALLMYQVLMYFYVSPVLNIERLYLPTFLRTFGYAIFFSTMTLYLKDLIAFPAFFHALTVSGFIRNGVAESAASGVYGYGLRRQIADTLVRGVHNDCDSILIVSIKEMFGVMCLVGTLIFLLMLLYDVQPVRRRLLRMPTIKQLSHKAINYVLHH